MMLYKTENFLVENTKRLVFFFCPYGVRIRQVAWAIKKLNAVGCSVVAYDFSKNVLLSGDPQYMINLAYETKFNVGEVVLKFKLLGYDNFGFVGSSLGSFIGYNCLTTTPELTWGVLITGGDSAEATWSLRKARKAFQQNGHTKETLRNKWHQIQWPELGDLSGRKFLMIASRADTTTRYESGVKCYNHLKDSGAEVTLITHNTLRHGQTITRNLLRIDKLLARVTLS